MARFDAVLFDLDGTLLDSVALILASYRHTLAHHAIAPIMSDAAILEGLGTPLEAQLARWVDDPDRIAAMIETYRTHNMAIHDSMVRPYPGVCALVRELEANDIALAVVTSKRSDGTRRGLRAIGLEDVFDVLVCADHVERHKPHPEPVHRAIAELGVRRERTVFVGDSTHDVIAGRAAGVHTAAVLWGPFARAALENAGADVVVETVDQLRALLLGSR
jgi:pyrophosphatase PpaX